MSYTRHPSPLSRIGGLSTILTVALVLTACSSGETSAKREYAVPSSLCGTKISPSALEPLLPGGKKISSQESGSPGNRRCRVSIDGQVVISSLIERWKPGTTLESVAFGPYGLTPSGAKKEEQRYIISDSAAVGHTDCHPQRKDGAQVFTVIRKEQGQAETKALEGAIIEFTDAVSTSKNCTEFDA